MAELHLSTEVTTKSRPDLAFSSAPSLLEGVVIFEYSQSNFCLLNCCWSNKGASVITITGVRAEAAVFKLCRISVDEG